MNAMKSTEANGWDDSAEAWLATLGDAGGFGRNFVLDLPMLARIQGRGYRTALDVGCGEGRFCRMLQAEGIHTVGIDPTSALIDHARSLDPEGDYRLARAEALEVAPSSVDLVVSYLSLIDIPDLASATSRIISALKPGGTLLIANLNSFKSAGMQEGWVNNRFSIDHYLDERVIWVSWRGIRIQNWHRPLSTYMTTFLENGLILRHFDEPSPSGGHPQKIAHYRRVPNFHVMEWQKPID